MGSSTVVLNGEDSAQSTGWGESEHLASLSNPPSNLLPVLPFGQTKQVAVDEVALVASWGLPL